MAWLTQNPEPWVKVLAPYSRTETHNDTRAASSHHHQQYNSQSGTASYSIPQLLTPHRSSNPSLRPGWGVPKQIKFYHQFLSHFPLNIQAVNKLYSILSSIPPIVECCPNYWDYHTHVCIYVCFWREKERKNRSSTDLMYFLLMYNFECKHLVLNEERCR